MNTKLTEEIVKHIMANFLIIPSEYVNIAKTMPLISSSFLLKEKINIELEGYGLIKNKIYGCQMMLGEQELKVLVANCANEYESAEYCMVIQLKNTPIYGLYFVMDKMIEHGYETTMISCSLDNKTWMPCSTYLQATFLAGMEQIKDLNMSLSVCKDYKLQYDGMLTFLDFYNKTQEANDAWQENQ